MINALMRLPGIVRLVAKLSLEKAESTTAKISVITSRAPKPGQDPRHTSPRSPSDPEREVSDQGTR